MKPALVAAAWVAAVVGGLLAARAAVRRAVRRSEDPVIGRLIKPPRYTYTGYDETLRSTAVRKRAVAEKSRQQARRVETTPNDCSGPASVSRFDRGRQC